MLTKIFIPIFVILLVGMVAFILWPQKKPVAVSTIANALTDSQEIECDYVDSDGLQTKTYTKAGMLRSNFTGSDSKSTGRVLIRDGKTK